MVSQKSHNLWGWLEKFIFLYFLVLFFFEIECNSKVDLTLKRRKTFIYRRERKDAEENDREKGKDISVHEILQVSGIPQTL